jgi:hypothetical protein
MSERLDGLRRAAAILGAMPSSSTQDTEYRAYKIIADEIERLDPTCKGCGAPLSDPLALACQSLIECPRLCVSS